MDTFDFIRLIRMYVIEKYNVLIYTSSSASLNYNYNM